MLHEDDDFGFQVSGLVLRDSVFGIRVSDSGFRDWDSGFRIPGIGGLACFMRRSTDDSLPVLSSVVIASVAVVQGSRFEIWSTEGGALVTPLVAGVISQHLLSSQG